MPHADASLVPLDITSKAKFWIHVREQLQHLLVDQRNWITNLANAASLIYNALLAFQLHFGSGDRSVNWCGFYLIASLFPKPRYVGGGDHSVIKCEGKLFLGPFCGKPACQFINVLPGSAQGVCAGSFLQQKTILVPNVNDYPGHIACDGETKSEIVCPLIIRSGNDQLVLGVLDLDCLALGGFNEEDRCGLESITDMIVRSCDW